MSYEINPETLAIIPLSETKSKIIEKHDEYVIDSTPYSVMEYSCEYFGSSLKGRLEGTKNMLGSIYKSPIIVEESRDIIFFPTISPNLPDNCWISLNNIKSIEKTNKSTIIVFENNKQIELDVPYLSLENQILRATRLESIYNKRKNNKKSECF